MSDSRPSPGLDERSQCADGMCWSAPLRDVIDDLKSELVEAREENERHEAQRDEATAKVDEWIARARQWERTANEMRARAERGESQLADAQAAADARTDLIGTLWLYFSRHAETQLTTEQKELYADCVEATGDKDSDFKFERWWRLPEPSEEASE